MIIDTDNLWKAKVDKKEHLLLLINDLLILTNDVLILINDLLIVINIYKYLLVLIDIY